MIENRVNTDVSNTTPVKDQLKSPEEFNLDEVANLLGSLGNHEAKCITLLSMQPGRVYTYRDLYKEVLRKQGDYEGWNMNPTTPYSYCEWSLSKIGLVTKEVLGPGLATVGYMRDPQRGEELGVPFAGSLLAFSVRHPEVSLLQLFSTTSSTSKEGDQEKKRAPHTRRKILWELATNPGSITTAELSRRIDEQPNVVDSHIRALKRHNLINAREYKQDNETVITYELAEDAPNQAPKVLYEQRKLTNLVHDIATTSGQGVTITVDDVYQKILGKMPDKTNLSKDRQYALIRAILNSFYKNGYLKITSKVEQLRQTDISITDETRDMLIDLLTILDRYESNDQEEISQGNKYAQEIINDPQTVAILLRKAKDTSPMSRTAPAAEMLNLVKGIVAELESSSGGRVTSKMIREKLTEPAYDRNLSEHSIRSYLRNLVESGNITIVESKGSEHFYSSNKNS